MRTRQVGTNQVGRQVGTTNCAQFVRHDSAKICKCLIVEKFLINFNLQQKRLFGRKRRKLLTDSAFTFCLKSDSNSLFFSSKIKLGSRKINLKTISRMQFEYIGVIKSVNVHGRQVYFRSKILGSAIYFSTEIYYTQQATIFNNDCFRFVQLLSFNTLNRKLMTYEIQVYLSNVMCNICSYEIKCKAVLANG